MISGRKKIVFILVTISSPILALIALEMVLALFFPQPPRGFSDNMFQSVEGLTSLRDGVEGSQYSREFHVDVKANEHGYRDGTWVVDEKGDKTLALLGDSFLFGWGVEAKNNVANVIAEKMNCSTLNLGMPGDNPRDQLKRIKRLKRRVGRVDAVVLFFFDNDLTDFDFRSPVAIQSERSDANPVISVRSFLLRSNVIRLGCRVLDAVGLSNVIADLTGYERSRENAIINLSIAHKKRFWNSDQWGEIKSVYRRMIQIAKSMSVEVVVIRIHPMVFSDDLKIEKHRSFLKPFEDYDFNLLNDRLRKFFASQGVSFHDFNPGNAPTVYYYAYDMHLNAKGHAALGDFVADVMENLNP